jgi:type IV secretory pathway protease TraF
MNKNTLQKISLFVIIAIMLFVLVNLLFKNIVINISNSHKGTFFYKTSQPPEKEEYVYFGFTHELLPKNIKTLSKQLVCIENDNLIVNNEFIICNSKKYKIKRNSKTPSGKNIPQFYYDGAVPKNKAIVWGENLESFDSRYWGFIDYNKLHKINLLF